MLRAAGVGSGQLRLNARVLGGIYQCTITNWNDPAIAALNPTLTCGLSQTALSWLFMSRIGNCLACISTLSLRLADELTSPHIRHSKAIRSMLALDEKGTHEHLLAHSNDVPIVLEI